MKRRLIAACLAAAAPLALSSIAVAQASTTSQDNDKPAVDPAAAVPPPAENDTQALAKQLSNPIASLISVPLQSNWDWGARPDGDGAQYRLNIQPVLPITLNSRWNLISRTIVPIVAQKNVIPSDHGQFGLGDVVQSLFLSPQKPTSGGLFGEWLRLSTTDGDGQAHWIGEMGCGTNDRRPEADGSLDLWCLGKSHLVGCGQRASLEC